LACLANISFYIHGRVILKLPNTDQSPCLNPNINVGSVLGGQIKKWQENGLIFPTTIGTPMAARNMYEDFRKILRRIGLPAVRFRDLRHTAATLMLQQGVHPKIVQERLGHADINMTLNIYSHVLPSMQEEAVEKLDELLIPIEVRNEIKQVSEVKASLSA